MTRRPMVNKCFASTEFISAVPRFEWYNSLSNGRAVVSKKKMGGREGESLTGTTKISRYHQYSNMAELEITFVPFGPFFSPPPKKTSRSPTFSYAISATSKARPRKSYSERIKAASFEEFLFPPSPPNKHVYFALRSPPYASFILPL